MCNSVRQSRLFCSYHGIKLVLSWRQVGPETGQASIRPNCQSQMKKLQLGLQVQVQNNCSEGVEEHHTTLLSIT